MDVKILNRVKIVLAEQRRTGTWLVQELGVSYVTGSKWCSYTTQTTLATLDQIAQILGVSAKDLINDTDHNQSIQ